MEHNKTKDPRDVLAKEWGAEINKKAEKECQNFRTLFEKALPPYKAKDGRIKGALKLYGEVRRLIHEARKGDMVATESIEAVVKQINNPQKIELVKAGASFLNKLQTHTSIPPFYRDGYLLEVAQEVAEKTPRVK